MMYIINPQEIHDRLLVIQKKRYSSKKCDKFHVGLTIQLWKRRLRTRTIFNNNRIKIATNFDLVNRPLQNRNVLFLSVFLSLMCHMIIIVLNEKSLIIHLIFTNPANVFCSHS